MFIGLFLRKKYEEKYYSNNEFVPVYIEDESKFIDYEGVQFHYKRSDNFKIAGIEGTFWFKNNIDDCYKEMKEIDKEVKNLFSNAERVTQENECQDKLEKVSRLLNIFLNLKMYFGLLAQMDC